MAQPAATAAAHAGAIRRSGARLIVFPEMSLTGDFYDAPPVAVDDARLAPIIDACRATGAVALVGVPVAGPCIGVLRVDGEGAAVVYRKMFVASSEQEYFKPGDAPSVVDVDGWRIGLAVCFDNCNAEHWSANSALDVDVYAAGVLDTAGELSTQDERIASFRPPGVAVAFASLARATGEGYGDTAGRSRIVGGDGTLLAQARPSVGEVVTATLAP